MRDHTTISKWLAVVEESFEAASAGEEINNGETRSSESVFKVSAILYSLLALLVLGPLVKLIALP